jgi:hypothetical protein
MKVELSRKQIACPTVQENVFGSRGAALQWSLRARDGHECYLRQDLRVGNKNRYAEVGWRRDGFGVLN